MIRRIRAALRALATGGLPDDLDALIEATRETYPTITREPTPIADAAWAATAVAQARIDLACEDWAEEVQALADIELQDLLRGNP